jgi:hypothetical protein
MMWGIRKMRAETRGDDDNEKDHRRQQQRGSRAAARGVGAVGLGSLSESSGMASRPANTT